jgi:DnaJ-class molecular chaperone
MNYYDTLGLRMGATPDEIKLAYRKLAKQHHPDSGGDVGKFQEVSNAYETLSDSNKRSQYDFQLKHPHQGHPGFQFEFNTGGNPFDIHDQFSQMFGFNFTHAQQIQRNRNIRVQVELEFLDTLNVSQRTFEYNLTSGREAITLDFPAGVNDQIFQINGRGDNAIPNVPRGNLEVVLRVKPHPKFTKVDDHIMTEITVDCFQAILGYEYDLTTPRGRPIKLHIPPGTQHGTQLGVTDEVFQRQNRTVGKLIVKINVLIPTALTSEQINLLQQIKQLRPVNT